MEGQQHLARKGEGAQEETSQRESLNSQWDTDPTSSSLQYVGYKPHHLRQTNLYNAQQTI